MPTRKLGVIGDWDNPYLTMNPDFEANILRQVGRLLDNGLLYRGFKPVHWCIDCQSALAEAEVEHQARISPAIDVLFPVVDTDELAKRLGFSALGTVSVVIWTTTPWTLPANAAVAFHPEHSYALIQTEKGSLILAQELAEQALKRYGFESVELLASFQGRMLEGLLVKRPFDDQPVPLLPADYVTLDVGTGLVHTAPAHGMDDYELGLKFSLNMVSRVGDDGRFAKDTPVVGGLLVWAANPVIIRFLEEKNLLLAKEDITHNYPLCWRHKTPIIFRATRQWFVRLDGIPSLRAKALEALQHIDFYPLSGRGRMEAMLRTRPDWCLSRQRRWGVPIALFAHRQTGEPHPQSLAFLEIVAKKVEKEGIEAWFALDPAEFLQEETKDYEKINDILDVWFDSGVTHACVLGKRPELAFPADLYLEGSDQHRGWFQSSLLTSVAISKEAPYQSILTHGFVVDAEGYKMSKSKGNIRSPQEIMNTLGADILRLWVAGSDYKGEIAFSEEILQRIVDAYRKTRNTVRFILGNLFDFDEKDLLPIDDCLAFDRYAVLLTQDFMHTLRQHYANYEFHPVVQVIHRFCAEELSGFYLDILKDRLYTIKADSHSRRSAQSSLYWITRTLLCAMAPILSFTAEEAFSHFTRKEESIFLETWPVLPLPKDEEFLRHHFSVLTTVRAEVNKSIETLRGQGKVGSSLEAEVICYAKPALLPALEMFGAELKFFFMTSSAMVLPEDKRTPEALPTSMGGLFLAVKKTTDPKCNRCWHHHPSVGEHARYPELCARCIDNLYGAGESRQHV